MASSSGAEFVNGLEGLSAAQKLRQKHEAEGGHQTTLQEVIDEDDIQHPPPSLRAVFEPEKIPSPMNTIPKSDVARGKQRAQEEITQPQPNLHDIPTKTASLNTHSEESFPALGSGRKSTTSSTPLAWGARKPSAVHTGLSGMNGHINGSNPSPSRNTRPGVSSVTPDAGMSPLATSPKASTFPHSMALPGKHSERIQFAPSQLLPRGQLKKPLQDTLRDLNRRSKARVDMKTGPNGTIIFEGSGPVEATRQALKDLAKEVGSKQQVKVPVPMSVRPYIIGRQGATIQAISKRTGARVQLPKVGDTPGFAGPTDDDDQSVDVSIEGDAVAAELARREIESIVNERTSTVNFRLRNIPAEFLPFIAGPHNAHVSALENGRPVRVEIPQYHTWSDQAPPATPQAGRRPDFVPSQSMHIKISGDRVAAQEVRAEIERQVEALQQQISLSQVPIDRGRHQFILDDSHTLHHFLADTGCAIILPPAAVDSEMLTVTGPPDRLESGMDRVLDLASAMQMSRIDIARQHSHLTRESQAHARALTQYLRQRRAIEELEQQLNARIVLPADDRSSSDWEVYVKDVRSGIKAKQEILNVINAHPPSRLRLVKVDPFFHRYVHEQTKLQLQNDFGVQLVKSSVIDPPEHVILVYEGPPSALQDAYQIPRQAPSPEELALFEQRLQQAQQHIIDLINEQDAIDTAELDIPSKYRDKLRRYVAREQQGLSKRQMPVQIDFIQTPNSTLHAVNGSVNGEGKLKTGPDNSRCVLRGPQNDLSELLRRSEDFIAAEKRDELERGHVISFPFPQKHMSYLIGKRGEHVNGLRDEFDVDIQTKEGQVDITGPETRAEAVKAKILALAKRLDDESTHIIKVPSKYHRGIIGAKGSQVNQLQDRYHVRIQFPRSTVNSADDQSVADDASQPSERPNRRPNQGPDEVIVRGPSRGADAARDEILSLLQWTIDNSHSAKVSVAQKQLPSLIGQAGQGLDNLRITTGAQIDVPPRDTVDASGRVDVVIKGNKKQVEEAKTILSAKATTFDDIVSRSIEVERQHHRSLIGAGGSNIRNIVVAAGGPDDRRELARIVRFPRPEVDSNTVHVEGSQAVVDKIIDALETFVSQRDGQTTTVLEVPSAKHRLLIGRGGETRKSLESQFKVRLDIPKINEEGPARSQIKLSGQPADIDRAKARIMEMTQDLPQTIVEIPRKHHHTIAENGQFFRRLRNDLKVSVEHGDSIVPKRPVSSKPSIVKQNNAMPLITDDQTSSDAHTFQLMTNDITSTEEGTIPWILQGSPANLEKAQTQIQKALERAVSSGAQYTGLLVLPDPSKYRFVVGQGGSKINEIRDLTGCKIIVPRDQLAGAAIEITGSEARVEQARDIILDITQHAGRRDFS